MSPERVFMCKRESEREVATRRRGGEKDENKVSSLVFFWPFTKYTARHIYESYIQFVANKILSICINVRIATISIYFYLGEVTWLK